MSRNFTSRKSWPLQEIQVGTWTHYWTLSGITEGHFTGRRRWSNRWNFVTRTGHEDDPENRGWAGQVPDIQCPGWRNWKVEEGTGPRLPRKPPLLSCELRSRHGTKKWSKRLAKSWPKAHTKRPSRQIKILENRTSNPDCVLVNWTQYCSDRNYLEYHFRQKMMLDENVTNKSVIL